MSSYATPEQIIAQAQRMTPAGGDVRNTLLTYGQSQGYSNDQMDQMLGLQPGQTAAYASSLSSPTPAAPTAAPTSAPPVAPPVTPSGTQPTFTPTPIPSSGSYDTEDWLTVLGGGAAGGVTGALAGAGVNQAIGRLESLGETGLTDYTNLATESTKNIQFTPYTLTSSVGTTQVNPDGSISSSLTPGMQANVDAATAAQNKLYDFSGLPDTSALTQGALTGAQTQLGQVGAGQEDLAALRSGYGTAAQGMTGMLGGSTTDMANQLFQQQQDMRTPAQQRQQLELENRLRAQGRLGTTTAAYGGTPEQLAMAKAIQEQQSADAFNSMTQAEQMATSQQARALGLGSATADLAKTQQALTQGDVATAQGLFNLGSASANLPIDLQGKQINQAGLLQDQAMKPAAAQLEQVKASGTLGKQAADTAEQQGKLFANVVGTGLQERLTAETAAAATRTKQYDSILKAVNTSSSPASLAADLLGQGIKKVGETLIDAAGNVIGKAADILGDAASNVWDSIQNQYNTEYYTGGVNPYELGQVTGEDPSIIQEGLDEVVSWFD